MKTKFLILLIILLLAGVLRLYKLGSIPPHLSPDEAAIGYNAYSILKTGRDEYGKFMPIIFKSFGDYKPGLYVYTAVPFIATLGLNEFSTRLPGALSGIASVLVLYLIIKKLFEKEKLALISAFLLALNPWHIYFSRGAWEISLNLLLTLLGIYFFVNYKNKYSLMLSAIFFTLTLWTYQGAKLSTGIVVAILIVLFFKELKKISIKSLAMPLIVGFVISLPIIFSLFLGQTGRLNVFSVLSYPRPQKYLQDFLDQGRENVGDINYYLFHPESLNFTRGILGRWFNHFSGKFLFFEGDWQNPRHSPPYQGMFVVGDLILFIVGAIYLSKGKIKREYLFFVFWAILAPLPAALSRDQVHAVRSFNLAIPLVVLSSFGLYWLISSKKFFAILVSLIYGATYIYYLDAYFTHLSVHSSQLWQYGYKQIVETIMPIQNNYKTIKVQQSYSQPYIYFLFYQHYDPKKYQLQSKLLENNFGDVGFVEKLDNLEFVPIDWSVESRKSGELVVADPIQITGDNIKDKTRYKLIEEIKYLNGETAFRIVEVK